MQAMLRWALVLSTWGAMACASGEDPDSTLGPSTGRTDASGSGDTGLATTTDSSVTDSSVGTDTRTEPLDTGTAPVDTGAPEDTSSPPIDTGTAPIDSGTPDTGTVVVDTGTPVMCSESGSYGGKCKTNLDCAMIAGCGYVCCGYDPSGTISLGCGRIAAGSFCLP
jgi:hypothetical protein